MHQSEPLLLPLPTATIKTNNNSNHSYRRPWGLVRSPKPAAVTDAVADVFLVKSTAVALIVVIFVAVVAVVVASLLLLPPHL